MDYKQISRNFHLYEFLQSDTGERHGYHDRQFNPPLDVVNNIEELVLNILQPLRDRLTGSIIISSGYRCEEVNKLVGGQKNSQHVTGQAADCIYKESGVINNNKLFNTLVSSGIEFDQAIKEYGTADRPAWIHISYNQDNNRNMKLTIL